MVQLIFSARTGPISYIGYGVVGSSAASCPLALPGGVQRTIPRGGRPHARACLELLVTALLLSKVY